MAGPKLKFRDPSGRFAIRANDGTYMRQGHKPRDYGHGIYSSMIFDGVMDWVELEDATLFDFAEAERLAKTLPKDICIVVRVERRVMPVQ